MGDIVTWLRIMEDGYRERGGSEADDFKRAADEIDRLRARIGELEALREAEAKLDVVRCELIDRLERELAEKDKRIEELGLRSVSDMAALNDAIDGHIITTDQINAAWAGSNAGCFEEEDFCAGVRWGLAELGIVACLRCGGTKWIYVAAKRKIPCDCPNNGWVMEMEER